MSDRRCKYCDLGGLTWRNTGVGWRLINPATGALHECRKGSPAEPAWKRVPATTTASSTPLAPPASSFNPPKVKLDTFDELIDHVGEMEFPEPPPDSTPSILAQLLADV